LKRRIDSLRRSPAPVTSGRAYPPSRGGRSAKPPLPEKAVLRSGLSLDRKLDIVGVVMIFIGLPTLLSLFSATHSGLTKGWLSLLARAFGWGAYLFPVALIFVGGWLVLRNFERVPRIQLERVFGLVLLFVLILVLLQFTLLPKSAEVSYAQAERGRGGGYLGAFLFELLRGGLGWGCTAIAVLAWLFIGLIFLLDVTVV
jgi:hypothetical protein